MGWVSSIGEFFKTVGIALGWLKREEEKKDDFKIAEADNLKARVKENINGQALSDSVRKLDDAELDKQLRDDGAGH